MDAYKEIPNKIIHDKGPVSKAFLNKGIKDFHEACEYILHLPYGRTTNKTDWKLVLAEGHGTCSTKHALIASLAAELSLNVHLMFGIYPMKESNTPGVGKILKNSKYDYLPEAHCYLRYNNIRIDITGLSNSETKAIDELFLEEQIVPEQIGNYKRDFHQKYIKQWAAPAEFSEIWSLREACIEGLSM